MRINGSLVFDSVGSSEILNLRVQKLISLPTYTAEDAGRLIFSVNEDLIYFGTSSGWQPLEGSGGGGGSDLVKLNAVITSIGPAIDAAGVFHPGAFSGFTSVTSPTSIYDVLAQLDAATSSGFGSLASANPDGVSLELSGTTLRIKSGGVSNAMLAYSSISFRTNSGAQSFSTSLGGIINFEAGNGLLVNASGSTITVSARDATSSVKGVASFNSSDFNISSGAVSAIPKSINTLTDVEVSAPAIGETFIYNGTNFVNKKFYYLYEQSTELISHSVTHNLNQKYCMVQVIDTSDEVIIPQSITFVSANNLVVTFSVAIGCKIVVTGV